MKPKSSPNDPIPAWLVKKCLLEFLPMIRFIINQSLEKGIFPDSLKHASVKPLVNKDYMKILKI